ncbi:MAG: aminotransferase class I/II-fold pyridoxal phosphate-dependent enzyme, partial [Bdellovibrionaceae bacterium]|nr:aminotransferase class I/II-fold pyridoxal phosphate-dependent enzyme [Pseudobdellovibrionaceae bacterium]
MKSRPIDLPILAPASEALPPRPREALLNPQLTRPDWLKQVPRSGCSLWLDKNENLDMHLLEVVRTVLTTIDPINICSYPECRALYEKLGQWVGVPANHLLLTPGSDGAIRLAFEAFTSPGEAVVHTVPTFAMYPVYSMMFGVKSQPLVYRRSELGPELKVEEILDCIETSRPRLVCLPNPDSPTGHVFSQENLRQVLSVC